MEKATKWWSKSKLTRIIRVIHRDLGFLVVGITLVYGISGIIMNHLGKQDPAYKSIQKSFSLSSGLDRESLTAEWEKQGDLSAIKRITNPDGTRFVLLLDGGQAVYQINDGAVSYEVYKRKPFVYWINRLHYNKANSWTFIADFFACSLIFLAISGLFMVKGKRGLSGTGKWWLVLGLLIPLVFVLLNSLK
jgi:Uncharacterized protein conserved in bacteria